VQLPGDTLLAAGRFAARGGTGNLFDLACDRVKPLMDVGDIARFPARRRLHRDAEIRRGGITDGRSEPVVQRHPGATRRGLGALAYGWIDTVNTPRYARIHASVRFRRSGAPPCAFSLPARPTDETIEFRAGRLPQLLTFPCYGKERVKESVRRARKLPPRFEIGRVRLLGEERVSRFGQPFSWRSSSWRSPYWRRLPSIGMIVAPAAADSVSRASSHHSATARSWRSPMRRQSSLPVSADDAVPWGKRLFRIRSKRESRSR